MERLRRALDWLHSHRWALIALQLTALTIVLVFFYWAFRDAWHEAKPLLREAVYECMPEDDLGALERAPGLAVLPLPDVVWQAPEREALELGLAS